MMIGKKNDLPKICFSNDKNKTLNIVIMRKAQKYIIWAKDILTGRQLTKIMNLKYFSCHVPENWRANCS